jgi:hypothetical protein
MSNLHLRVLLRAKFAARQPLDDLAERRLSLS